MQRRGGKPETFASAEFWLLWRIVMLTTCDRGGWRGGGWWGRRVVLGLHWLGTTTLTHDLQIDSPAHTHLAGSHVCASLLSFTAQPAPPPLPLPNHTHHSHAALPCLPKEPAAHLSAPLLLLCSSNHGQVFAHSQRGSSSPGRQTDADVIALSVDPWKQGVWGWWVRKKSGKIEKDA